MKAPPRLIYFLADGAFTLALLALCAVARASEPLPVNIATPVGTWAADQWNECSTAPGRIYCQDSFGLGIFPDVTQEPPAGATEAVTLVMLDTGRRWDFAGCARLDAGTYVCAAPDQIFDGGFEQ